MLKKLLFAGCAFGALSTTAWAADIIEPTAYDWTGPYIGLQGGYGWGKTDVTLDPAEDTTTPGALARGEIIVDNLDGEIEADGFIGGLHLGYNFQMDSLLLGLEGDIEYSDMSGKADIFQSEGDDEPIGEARKDIDWLGSLRLRAGFTLDRALIYATGGLAAGEVESRSEAPNAFAKESDTEWGWTVGGGLEYAFSDALSGRIEYRYTDLDDSKLENDLGTAKIENDFHAVRAGLSWHFGAM
ncbi:MAG: outer membrane protein [Parvibaculaceae bacterium]